jgi:hypothetical protein
VRVVDGIEFWESGTPNRKFKILGVLDHSRLHYVVALGSRDGAIAKAAKERGADAVVLGPQVSDMMLVNRNSGYVVSEQHTKAALIKYLP